MKSTECTMQSAVCTVCTVSALCSLHSTCTLLYTKSPFSAFTLFDFYRRAPGARRVRGWWCRRSVAAADGGAPLGLEIMAFGSEILVVGFPNPRSRSSPIRNARNGRPPTTHFKKSPRAAIRHPPRGFTDLVLMIS